MSRKAARVKSDVVAERFLKLIEDSMQQLAREVMAEGDSLDSMQDAIFYGSRLKLALERKLGLLAT